MVMDDSYIVQSAFFKNWGNFVNIVAILKCYQCSYRQPGLLLRTAIH